MMKIVASLVLLGLCANVALATTGAAPVSSSNSGAFSSSVLNSTAIKVWSAANSTDAANWDSSTTTTNIGGVYYGSTWFGPGATNDTSYVWGVPVSGYTTGTTTGDDASGSTTTYSTTSALRKRTLNNTVVGWGNDTVEASVISDTSVSVTIMGSGVGAVGPGYFAYLTSGADSATATNVNYQVWLTLITGSTGSASTSALTKNADVLAAAATASPVNPCTTTTVGTGNIWYDIGAGAFFYTYWKQVVSPGTPSGAGSCTSAGTTTTVNTIYLGGMYVNGSAYWTSPLVLTPATPANAVGSLMGGGDNWLNSSNIYVVYVDSTVAGSGTGATGITYVSKTSKSATSGGSFSALATNSITGTVSTAGYLKSSFVPVSVWASNFTYGITVSNVSIAGASSATTYTYTNYLNGSTTGMDSGLSNTGATGTGAFYGWQLNTGYSIVASWKTSSTSPTTYSYTLATYYGNGTANTTAATIGSLASATSAQFYEDVNGTMWIGWQDADTANAGITYAGYLAKFQGQLNVPSGASILSAISAFFALFLAAIFVF